MASTKEGAMAFMPSSNDSIPTHRQSNGAPSDSSISTNNRETDELEQTLRSLPHVRTIPSPPSNALTEDNIPPRNSLPLRQSVSSASPLPHELPNGGDSKPLVDYQDLYFELQTHHNHVVQTLRQHIKSLEIDLKKSRNDTGGYSWDEKRDPMSIPVHSPHATRYRKTSASNGVGPKNERSSNSGSQAEKTSNIIEQRRVSSSSSYPPESIFNGLSSIPEDGYGRNGVIDGVDESQTYDIDKLDEDPRSPPSTANGISTPPNLRTLAGRTPPAGGMLNKGLPNARVYDQTSHYEEPDEDPVLSEPRIIRNTSEIDMLDQKLQQVASDPDMSIPQAIRSGSYSQADGEDTISGQESSDVEGVVLKRKPSTNFGVPFGMARPDIPRRN